MYLPFTACLVQRTVSLARRLLSAGENEYSTGYILCQQKIYFFSKIFHFFSFFFFRGGRTGEFGGRILPDDRGKAPGGGMPRAGPARPMGSGARPHSRGVGAAEPPVN